MKAERKYAYEWAAQVICGSLEMNSDSIDYDPKLHPWKKEEHAAVMGELRRIYFDLLSKSRKTT
jgi:hypothetical protein